MGVVASVIFAEKVLPGGALLSRVTGIALIAAGVMLAAGLR
jgi:predicted metal-binding membrane protein